MKVKYYSHLEGCVVYVDVNVKVAHALESFKKQRKKRLNDESHYKFISLNKIVEMGHDIPDHVDLDDIVILREKDKKYLQSNDYKRFYRRLRKEISSKFDIMGEKIREAMFLRYFKNMSIGQVAKAMNCSKSTAQTHLQRGTKHIKEFLDRDIEEQDKKDIQRAYRKAKKY